MDAPSRTAVALFSGGLDSILAARLVQEQGVAVKCLHFVTPFFGKPERVAHWRTCYGLDITPCDIGDDFAAMLAARPRHGFGKALNPCVDCKILMLRKARELMAAYGARFIISGEVLGQRPMSQRRDTLNIIRRDADVAGVLLRPLSARLLDETEAETDGLVDRSRLGAISGRGRKEQMVLAARFGITEIPTPAGGCRLTEVENARSYWPVLTHSPAPGGADFTLANTGRQYWSLAGGTPLWLCIGRNQVDNAALLALARPGDILFKTAGFPGPVSLARVLPGQVWDEAAIASAAAFCASFSPGAVRFAAATGRQTAVLVCRGPDFTAIMRPAEEKAVPAIPVSPDRETPRAWRAYPWKTAREAIRTEARLRLEAQQAKRKTVRN